MKQRIWFEFTQQALHKYPGHPTLGEAHQHVFGFRVELGTKKDRELEFLEFRNIVKSEFLEDKLPSDRPSVMDFEDRSCETLAQELVAVIKKILPVEEWKGTPIIVSAAENDEHAGAIVEDKV